MRYINLHELNAWLSVPRGRLSECLYHGFEWLIMATNGLSWLRMAVSWFRMAGSWLRMAVFWVRIILGREFSQIYAFLVRRSGSHVTGLRGVALNFHLVGFRRIWVFKK